MQAGIDLALTSIYWYSWNVLMLVKSVEKGVNGFITTYTEWCGMKTIRCDLVLSCDFHNLHKVIVQSAGLLSLRISLYQSMYQSLIFKSFLVLFSNEVLSVISVVYSLTFSLSSTSLLYGY